MIQSVINCQNPLRSDVEDYIRKVFVNHYGATVRQFPKRLATILGPDLKPLCAAGIRTAEDGFFSEVYLPGPIETLLSQTCRTVIQRNQLIEVTSLASDRAGYAFALLDYIIQIGRKEGRSWGIFTATEKICRRIERTGLSFTSLGSAKMGDVPNPEDWGRYYDTNPVVCAMHDQCDSPISFQVSRTPPGALSSGFVIKGAHFD